jgi:SAM-dependent methyltransferase
LEIRRDSRILDIGCGDDIGWVPEFYHQHPFGTYQGIDRLQLDQIRIIPTEYRDPRSEDIAIKNPCDWECRFKHWSRHTTVSDPISWEKFIQLVDIKTEIDLEQVSLPLFLTDQAPFDLVIVSDLIHMLNNPRSRECFVSEVQSLTKPGGFAFFKFFTVRTAYGPNTGYPVDESEINKLNRLFSSRIDTIVDQQVGKMTILYRR